MTASRNTKASDGKGKGEGGFTLIEILIALTVFAVGILSVAALQTSSVRGDMKSRQIAEESVRASSGIEALRGLSYDHGDLDEGAHVEVNAEGEEVFTWVVVTENTGEGDEYKSVSATASWTDRGENKSFTINFIKSSSN